MAVKTASATITRKVDFTTALVVEQATLLMSPVITSCSWIEVNTYRTYNNGDKWVLKNMNNPPAKMPQTFDTMLRQGTLTSAARYFGAKMNSTGSSAMTRRESSSSVTFMVPISAAKAEPDLPLTAMAVSSGPSSRVKPTATRSITYCIAPKRRSSDAPCIARMNPVQIAIKETMGIASTPISSICLTVACQR